MKTKMMANNGGTMDNETTLKTHGIVGRDDPSNFKALTLSEAKEYALQCYNGEDKDFRSYSPEILSIIEAENLRYNRDCEKAAMRLFPDFTDDLDGANQNRYLSRLVYNTKCYQDSCRMLEAQIAFEKQMNDEGYRLATSESVIAGHRYTVARQGAKPERLLARQYGDMILWCKKANSRRGYYAFNDEYIK